VNPRSSCSAVLITAGCLLAASSRAHHSLASFDVSTPLWVKGTVVRFERVNPHSLIFMDERLPNGQVRRWAVDGPSTVQLERKGLGQEFLKPGEVLEVCGFGLRDSAAAQRTLPKVDGEGAATSGSSLTGQVMNGTLLVMADGKKHVWSDYGQLRKCVSAEDEGALIR